MLYTDNNWEWQTEHLSSGCVRCEVFEITLSRGYNEQSFRDDLKILYTKLGQENKQVAFLFTDQHVAEEGGSLRVNMEPQIKK